MPPPAALRKLWERLTTIQGVSSGSEETAKRATYQHNSQATSLGMRNGQEAASDSFGVSNRGPEGDLNKLDDSRVSVHDLARELGQLRQKVAQMQHQVAAAEQRAV